MSSSVQTASSFTRAVGIGELVVSTNPADKLITYSLGSCIGVTMHDPVHGVGGLIHCMLPLSKIDPDKAKARPGMFVDTGMITMLNELQKAGGCLDNMVVKLAGAGAPMDHAGRFKIGERNVTVFRKLMWKNNLLIQAEDIGGSLPRTMSLHMSTGLTTLRIERQEVEL